MIRLVPLTRENYGHFVVLCVDPEQERWVGSVAEAMADAYFRPEYEMRGIVMRAGDDNTAAELAVGFLMFERHSEDVPHSVDSSTITLQRFMIDCHRQGHGYGRAALREFIHLVRTQFPHVTQLHLLVHKDAVAAQKTYKSVGFRLESLGMKKIDYLHGVLDLTSSSTVQ